MIYLLHTYFYYTIPPPNKAIQYFSHFSILEDIIPVFPNTYLKTHIVLCGSCVRWFKEYNKIKPSSPWNSQFNISYSNKFVIKFRISNFSIATWLQLRQRWQFRFKPSGLNSEGLCDITPPRNTLNCKSPSMLADSFYPRILQYCNE